MTADGLLSVTPEALAKAILARRKATGSSLPEELEKRTEENDRAHALTSESKAQLKSVDTGPEEHA